MESELDRRFFFVHVMKVGGSSLLRMLRESVFDNDTSRMYPSRDDAGRLDPAIRLATLRDLPPERRERIRVYAGHFPYAALPLVGQGAQTLALFRDPVERAVSHLKHTVQWTPLYKGMTLEEAYEDRQTFDLFFDNLQVRAFALRSLEGRASLFEKTSLTEADLSHAVANVRNLAAFGLTERFEEFLRILGVRFGFRFQKVLRVNRTAPADVSPSLRERLAADLELDRRFYAAVREIYAERLERLISEHGELPRNYEANDRR